MEINICIASDNNYAKFLGVCMQSIIDNASNDNIYNIHILDGGISEINKSKLNKIQNNICKIHYIDMNSCNKLNNIKSLHVSGHISLATYYRLFLAEIFTDINKMLYVDCDVIFMKDPAEIFKIDIEHNLFGAVKDIGILNDRNRGKFDYKYFNKYIKLDNYDNYFNAGVLLYNLEEIRKYKEENIFDIIKINKKPKFHDQCYLNTYAKGKVKFLPFIWNYWGGFKIENPDYKTTFPKAYIEDLEKAAIEPGIIHAKPWNNPDNEWSEAFFYYARKTPFYETILYETIKKKTVRKIKKFLFFKIKYRV